MGNDKRFGDRRGASHEWGSKGRKEDARANKHRFDAAAIEDSQDIEPQKVAAPTPSRKRKDTKRWCRGKEGQEHDPQYLRSWGFGRWRYREYHCSRCGQRTHERNRSGSA